jgi:ribosome-associated toxin RatA of RatAB toxin-antitoxin module
MQVKYEPWVIRNDDKEVWGVKILDGKFENTTFSINELDQNDTNQSLELDYTVLSAPEGMVIEDVAGSEFDDVINFIIRDILQKAVNEYENRKSNSPESGE